MLKKKALYTYTTKIEPTETIGEIQDSLVSHGAKQVVSNYNDTGLIEALSFVIVTPEGRAIAIRLPCDPEPVFKVLERQAAGIYKDPITHKVVKIPRSYATRDQALRVAWRIVKHWVDAQMALLETQMVKMEQIFLPYAIVKDGRTLFESMKTGKYALLDAKVETSTGAEEGIVVN